MNSAQAQHRGDDGFATVEILVVVPIAVLLLVLVFAVGRTSQARIQVTGAAAAAARAASLARTPGYGTMQAQSAASAALPGTRLNCTGGPHVSTNTGAFRPGGRVTVTVACDVTLRDLGFPGLPGTKTFTATASSPIETYRGQG